MNSLRLDEEAKDYGGASQGGLKPEDITPAAEGDNDTSDEGPYSCEYS